MPSSADIRYAYEQIVQHGHCECSCGQRFLTEDGYCLHLDRDDCGSRIQDKAEVSRLQALLAKRDAEIARLKLTTRSDREYAEQKQRAEEAEGEIARLVELGERMRAVRGAGGHGAGRNGAAGGAVG